MLSGKKPSLTNLLDNTATSEYQGNDHEKDENDFYEIIINKKLNENNLRFAEKLSAFFDGFKNSSDNQSYTNAKIKLLNFFLTDLNDYMLSFLKAEDFSDKDKEMHFQFIRERINDNCRIASDNKKKLSVEPGAFWRKFAYKVVDTYSPDIETQWFSSCINSSNRITVFYKELTTINFSENLNANDLNKVIGIMRTIYDHWSSTNENLLLSAIPWANETDAIKKDFSKKWLISCIDAFTFQVDEQVGKLKKILLSEAFYMNEHHIKSFLEGLIKTINKMSSSDGFDNSPFHFVFDRLTYIAFICDIMICVTENSDDVFKDNVNLSLLILRACEQYLSSLLNELINNESSSTFTTINNYFSRDRQYVFPVLSFLFDQMKICSESMMSLEDRVMIKNLMALSRKVIKKIFSSDSADGLIRNNDARFFKIFSNSAIFPEFHQITKYNFFQKNVVGNVNIRVLLFEDSYLKFIIQLISGMNATGSKLLKQVLEIRLEILSNEERLLFELDRYGEYFASYFVRQVVDKDKFFLKLYGDLFNKNVMRTIGLIFHPDYWKNKWAENLLVKMENWLLSVKNNYEEINNLKQEAILLKESQEKLANSIVENERFNDQIRNEMNEANDLLNAMRAEVGRLKVKHKK